MVTLNLRDEIVENFARQYLWGDDTPSYSTTTIGSQHPGESPPLTFDGIAKLAIKLREWGPAPVTIWLVNRPEWLDKMTALILKPKAPLSPGLQIRIINWQTAGFDPSKEAIAYPGENRDETIRRASQGVKTEIKVIWPWVCHVPGVWIEMSDGSWRFLQDAIPSRDP